MRTLLCLVALASLSACGPASTGDAATFCAELAESNEGCWNEELDADCLDVYAECGENIVVAESCPVQLGCS